jgi:hypothetical protein
MANPEQLAILKLGVEVWNRWREENPEVRPDFCKADLSKVFLGYTIFGNTDLSQVKGLENVTHNFPSTIGIDTIYRSEGNIPESFLRGCGVPYNFITYMGSLTVKAFEFYSVFISYSTKDEEFAKRLHADFEEFFDAFVVLLDEDEETLEVTGSFDSLTWNGPNT